MLKIQLKETKNLEEIIYNKGFRIIRKGIQNNYGKYIKGCNRKQTTDKNELV